MYGILSLIGKKFGKDAMRRVLAITQNFPDDRFVRSMKNPNITDSSRLGAAGDGTGGSATGCSAGATDSG